jgi:hypothetical protein
MTPQDLKHTEDTASSQLDEMSRRYDQSTTTFSPEGWTLRVLA